MATPFVVQEGGITVEVSLRVLSLRYLPSALANKGPFRIQASLGGGSSRSKDEGSVGGQASRRETGESLGGKGLKSQEALWLKGPESMLVWRMSESDLSRLKAYSPKFKCFVLTGQEVVGWFMMDIRDLPGSNEQRWVKVQGAAASGAEIRVTGHIKYVPAMPPRAVKEQQGMVIVGDDDGALQRGGGQEKDIQGDQAAFPIGSGSDPFLLTISINRIGGDGTGLLLPGSGAGGMWLSYCVFDVVAQTDKFEGLDAPCRPAKDMFRLQSSASGQELLEWFSQEKNRYLAIYLCTENRVIAVMEVDLLDLLFGHRKASGDVSERVFPLEAEGRFEMERWEEDSDALPAKGGAWVHLRISLARNGDRPCSFPQMITACPPPLAKAEGGEEKPMEAPSRMEDGGSYGASQGGEKEQQQDAEDEENYSDDFSNEEMTGTPRKLATARTEKEEEEEEEDDNRQPPPLPSVPTSPPSSQQLPQVPSPMEPLEEPTTKQPEEEASLTSPTLVHPNEPAPQVEKEDIPVPSGDDPKKKARASPSRRLPPKPPGIRRFRLSIDLRSIKGLKHSQHIFLYYHYPHLPGDRGGGGSTLDNPVVTAPVWVSAVTETPMSKSCCLFYFSSTYQDLQEVANQYPFLVSVRAKEGGGGEGTEIGKAGLPLPDLVEASPLHYRCPVKHRIFRSYESCAQHLVGLMAQGEAARDACPVIVYAIDQSLPILGKEGLGGGMGACPTLRAVMVLEDLGPEDAGLLPPVTTDMTPEQPVVTPPSRPALSWDLLEIEKRRLEWEEWRQREELAWNERLRTKEVARMEELEKVFLDKEKERKGLFARSQEEYHRLESKLRKSLMEVEAREMKLSAVEEELKQQATRKTLEVQQLQRRLREDSKHQLDLEKRKCKELEERIGRLEKDLQASNSKYNDLQEEYARYRKEQRKAPVAVLHNEIAKLKGEKAEAESRWERERAEKNKALLEKEQYRSALQRTARALKREQGRHLTNLRQELEQLKIEYLAREERFRLDGEREELQTIRRELNALRDLGVSMNQTVPGVDFSSPGHHPTINKNKGSGSSKGNKENMVGGEPWMGDMWFSSGPGGPHKSPSSAAPVMEATQGITTPELEEKLGGIQQDPELWRLKREKEDLMATGLYEVDHPIIAELSRLIDAKTSSGSSRRGGLSFEGQGGGAGGAGPLFPDDEGGGNGSP